MISNRMHYAIAAALVASLALAGCKKKEETVITPPPAASEPAPMPPAEPMPAAVSVVSVDLGKAVGADNKVDAAITTFAPKDTIYTVVMTDGTAANAPLMVTWTAPDGSQVASETKMLNTTGPATTEFHATKPDGFPVGKYKADVSLNGAVVQSREFEVK
jgi:hypothetical protein